MSGSFGPLGDEKYAEYCQDIRQSGSFLLRIISDILEMARLELAESRSTVSRCSSIRSLRRRWRSTAPMRIKPHQPVDRTAPDLTLS